MKVEESRHSTTGASMGRRRPCLVSHGRNAKLQRQSLLVVQPAHRAVHLPSNAARLRLSKGFSQCLLM